jgi:hypothetical protein
MGYFRKIARVVFVKEGEGRWGRRNSFLQPGNFLRGVLNKLQESQQQTRGVQEMQSQQQRFTLLILVQGLVMNQVSVMPHVNITQEDLVRLDLVLRMVIL